MRRWLAVSFVLFTISAQSHAASIVGSNAQRLFHALRVTSTFTEYKEIKSAGAVTCARALSSKPSSKTSVTCGINLEASQEQMQKTYESLKVIGVVDARRVGASVEVKAVGKKLLFYKIKVVRPGVPAKYSIEIL